MTSRQRRILRAARGCGHRAARIGISVHRPSFIRAKSGPFAVHKSLKPPDGGLCLSVAQIVRLAVQPKKLYTGELTKSQRKSGLDANFPQREFQWIWKRPRLLDLPSKFVCSGGRNLRKCAARLREREILARNIGGFAHIRRGRGYARLLFAGVCCARSSGTFSQCRIFRGYSGRGPWHALHFAQNRSSELLQFDIRIVPSFLGDCEFWRGVVAFTLGARRWAVRVLETIRRASAKGEKCLSGSSELWWTVILAL